MHKRKYTREQLEFYFKQVMDKLKRIPREEDLVKFPGTPSVTAYVDRFGSWQNVVNLFGNMELSKRKCVQCGKELIRKNKKQKFCSPACAQLCYAKKSTRYTPKIESKIKEILGSTCFVCNFEAITEIHALDGRDSNQKVLRAYNKKNLHEFILLCPNHHALIHQKYAKIFKKNDELIYEEE